MLILAKTKPNILGVKWLNQAFCPAQTLVLADRNVARNPQRFIHANHYESAKKRTKNDKKLK